VTHSRTFLTASLALWRRRLDHRRRRREATRGTGRFAHYDGLVREALEAIARRKRQLAELAVTTVGDQGLALIRGFEGWIPYPYDDATEQPWSQTQLGVKTIGWGFTSEDFPAGKMPARLSRRDGDRLLRELLDRRYAPAVAALEIHEQHVFDGVLSFVFNCGTGAVSPATRVGALLRRRQYAAAANAMQAWNQDGRGHVLEGLARRRRAERTLMLTGKVDLS